MDIAVALCLGLGVFAASWLLHFVIWRIYRPEAYPIWLPIIFLFIPTASAMALGGSEIIMPFHWTPETVVAAFFLHSAIASCYMAGYAGIVEYSPSAEILRTVKNAMPQGIDPEFLNVSTLSEEALTGKRIRHLIQSRMAVTENGALRLTSRGQAIVALCRTYRVIFGLKQEANG